MAVADVVMSIVPVWRAVAIGLLTPIVYFVYRFIRIRTMMRRLQAQGLPMLPHSFIWGHLPIFGKLVASLPPDANHDYVQWAIWSQWKTLFPDRKTCPAVVYVDAWPFTVPMAIVIDPAVSAQFTQDVSAAKISQHRRFFWPLTFNQDVASTADYGHWRVLGRMFNPAFSPQNITNRVPSILKDVEMFAQVLEAKCGGNGSWGPVFELEHATVNLAIDVMTRFLLDTSTLEQKCKRSPMMRALINSISHCMFYITPMNFFTFFSPMRWCSIWRNKVIMDNFLEAAIKKEAAAFKAGEKDAAGGKTVMHVAFESLAKETGNPEPRLDRRTMETFYSNLKTFLFGGHDTTASTLCMVYHQLIKHPDILARVRAEHDEILGGDPQAALQVLTESPYVVNSLTLTHAVIKESLRLHPITSSARVGAPDLFLVDPTDGLKYPTDNFFLWDGITGIHHREDIWPRVEEFLPERWMTTDISDPLHPVKNAWRAFEMGQRNCIGQNLAMMEMKMALALTARTFEMEHAWNDRTSEHEIWGDRVYLIGTAGMPRVKGGMPVRVRSRTKT